MREAKRQQWVSQTKRKEHYEGWGVIHTGRRQKKWSKVWGEVRQAWIFSRAHLLNILHLNSYISRMGVKRPNSKGGLKDLKRRRIKSAYAVPGTQSGLKSCRLLASFRVSQPQHYCHFEPDNSHLWWVVHALWKAQQHPWAPPTRCQQYPCAPTSRDNPVCLQVFPTVSPWAENHWSLWEREEGFLWLSWAMGHTYFPLCVVLNEKKKITQERYIWAFAKFPLGPDFSNWMRSSLEWEEIWQMGFGHIWKVPTPTQHRTSSGLQNGQTHSISSSLPSLQLVSLFD